MTAASTPLSSVSPLRTITVLSATQDELFDLEDKENVKSDADDKMEIVELTRRLKELESKQEEKKKDADYWEHRYFEEKNKRLEVKSR